MGDYRPKIEQRVLREVLRMATMLALALAQTALAPSLWHFRIDWVLVVVITLGLLRGLPSGLRWAAYGGLSLGLLSPLPMGSHLLGLLLAVTAAVVATDAFHRDNRAVPTIAVVLVSLIYAGVIALVMAATGRPIVWSHYPFTIMLPTALANGVVALPTYLLIARIQQTGKPNIGLET